MSSLKMFCKDFYISISISIISSKLESAYRLRTRLCVCLRGCDRAWGRDLGTILTDMAYFSMFMEFQSAFILTFFGS